MDPMDDSQPELSGHSRGCGALTGKEPQTLRVARWPQGTTFRPWNASIHDNLFLTSHHPNQVVAWQVDKATNCSDLDHSGYAVRTSSMELETLDAQDAKGLMAMFFD